MTEGPGPGDWGDETVTCRKGLGQTADSQTSHAVGASEKQKIIIPKDPKICLFLLQYTILQYINYAFYNKS